MSDTTTTYTAAAAAAHHHHHHHQLEPLPPAPASSSSPSSNNNTPSLSSGAISDQGRPIKRRRKNATRACDRCKDKKTKCDGTRPCIRCTSNNEVCSYEKPYLRGTLPTVPPARSPSIVHSASPPHSPAAQSSQPTTTATKSSLPVLAINDLLGDRTRESSVEAVNYESFLGESSNLVFSHAAQHQLSSSRQSDNNNQSQDDEQQQQPQNILSLTGETILLYEKPNGCPPRRVCGESVESGRSDRETRPLLTLNRHFWSSEPPFPDLNVAAFSLPSKAKALEFVAWYFENASPTYRFLHRPTIEAAIHDGLHGCDEEWWGPAAMGAGSKVFEDKSVCAVVFMVWAIGCQFPKDMTTEERIRALRQRSVQFYQCAKMQLDKERSQIDRLATLQAKLLMTIYLLTTSSVKAAWDLFAVVKNMANSLGLSRRRPQHLTALGPLHLEVRRRALWAIYTLDSYMCTMLGKTLTWDDNDVTEEYPTLEDDGKLIVDSHRRPIEDAHESSYDAEVTRPSEGHNSQDGQDGPCLMEAPIVHAKLAKIVRLTLRRLYGDYPAENPSAVRNELEGMLDEWENSLPEYLRTTKGNGKLLVIYARQNNVIQLAHAHALIMIFRSSLPLSDLTTPAPSSATDLGPTSPASAARTLVHQEKCLQAALRASQLVFGLARKKGLTGAFWFSAYIAFCAATVCYVYVVRNATDHRRDEILEAAERCCEVERLLAGEGENQMARRYSIALDGLARQVRKRLFELDPTPETAKSSEPPTCPLDVDQKSAKSPPAAIQTLLNPEVNGHVDDLRNGRGCGAHMSSPLAPTNRPTPPSVHALLHHAPALMHVNVKQEDSYPPPHIPHFQQQQDQHPQPQMDFYPSHPQAHPQQFHAPPPTSLHQEYGSYNPTAMGVTPEELAVNTSTVGGLFNLDENNAIAFQNFQGLDATVSGGYLFGWPNGPVY